MDKITIPLSIQGDSASLKYLLHVLAERQMTLLNLDGENKFPESWQTNAMWVGIVEQAIKDAEHDENRLNF